jgi:hypothetical protein
LSLVDGDRPKLRRRGESQWVHALPQLLLPVSEVAIFEERTVSLIAVVTAEGSLVIIGVLLHLKGIIKLYNHFTSISNPISYLPVLKYLI